MPRIRRFAACELAIFFRDHPPPHFHILSPDGEARVRIDTLDVLTLTGRPKMLDALTWAAENREFLLQKWKELQ